jgi:hypothetical protein
MRRRTYYKTARYVLRRVYAVDVPEHMIECCRDAVDSINVEYSIIYGLHLPQEDRSATSIFSTHVLRILTMLRSDFHRSASSFACWSQAERS